MPQTRSRNNRRSVVALVYNGLCTFEFGIVAEVFGLARPELDFEWYEFNSVAVEDGQLFAAGGLEFTATGTQEDLDRADTVVIPGWRGKDVPVPTSMRHAVCQAYSRGARLMSVCSGAYVLAAAGILDGRKATTHWRYAQHLSEMFPEVCLEPNRLYIEHGNILTSAGSSAGIDMCLHVVRADCGAVVANSVARRLVMHAHRQGGQSQFIEQPVPADYEASRLSSTLDFIRSNLDQAHSVDSLAEHARMSSRTFQRKFVALTGVPVGKWIAQERVTRACSLLETTDSSLNDISASVGLSRAEHLQYHFRNFIGVSPGQYRKRFTEMDTSTD